MSRKVKLISTGFRLTPDQYNTFRRKLPRNGDRSRFLSRVVEMFNNGELEFDDFKVRRATTQVTEQLGSAMLS